MTTTIKTINLPTIRRQEETVSSGQWYLIIWDSNTSWSVTTAVYATIEECYAEARQIIGKQFRISADAAIKDYHGQWQY